MRQLSVPELADRLGRRHVGAVLGTLDLAADHTEILSRGRVHLPDGRQPGPDTFFEIGSITKTFTALALAVLVRSGSVSLDTAVRDLLPTGTRVPSRNGSEITLEQLARHTSGLPRSANPMLREIRDVLRGGNPYDMDEATALESLSRVSVKHDPGQGHGRYSNLGGGLLGIALRRAAGVDSYYEMLSATVLQPLRLSDTLIHPTDHHADRLAQGYGFRRRPVASWYLEGLAGAGALRSTAADMLRYLRAQLEPDGTPLAEAIRLTRQLWEPSRRMTIGLGWIRTRMPNGDMWWHNGGTGGFRSFAGFSPERGHASVVMVNDVRSPDRAGVQVLASLSPRPTRRGSGPSGPPA